MEKKEERKIDWVTNVSTGVNDSLISLGFQGHNGGRRKFKWKGKTYYLLEA